MSLRRSRSKCQIDCLRDSHVVSAWGINVSVCGACTEVRERIFQNLTFARAVSSSSICCCFLFPNYLFIPSKQINSIPSVQSNCHSSVGHLRCVSVWKKYIVDLAKIKRSEKCLYAEHKQKNGWVTLLCIAVKAAAAAVAIAIVWCVLCVCWRLQRRRRGLSHRHLSEFSLLVDWFLNNNTGYTIALYIIYSVRFRGYSHSCRVLINFSQRRTLLSFH